MGVLIAIVAALLVGLLLLGLATKLVVQLGVLAFAILAAAAIGSLWLSAAIGAAAFFAIGELVGVRHAAWALSGGLLTGAVVWVGMIWGIWREVMSAPQRLRRMTARFK